MIQKEKWLEPYVRDVKRVAEWGIRAGAQPGLLPSSVNYHGFDIHPAPLQQCLFPQRELRDPALALPLESASQDLFLCLDLLEFLRMDQLYMVISEARRILHPGGICLLRALAKDIPLGRWIHPGQRPLELTHYISPEDWRTLADFREGGFWLKRQTLTLERLSPQFGAPSSS